MKHILLVFLLLSGLSINAQKTETDTATSKQPESWDRYYPGIRIGFGTHKAFYSEIGLVWQRFHFDPRRGFAANTYYTAFEWTPGTKRRVGVYGIKIGAESVYNAGTGGIEIKYLKDTGRHDVVVTPKLGLGAGVLTFFYGYNLSVNKFPFDHIRRHQFSLTINTSAVYYDWRRKRSKR